MVKVHACSGYSSLDIVACRAVYRQQLSKCVLAAMNTHATVEVLLEMGFSAVVHAEEL
jgi:hypothetical protein